MLQLRPHIRGGPESQRSYQLPPLGPVQQVERHHARRDGSQQSDQFAETEIQKRHLFPKWGGRPRPRRTPWSGLYPQIQNPRSRGTARRSTRTTPHHSTAPDRINAPKIASSTATLVGSPT